MRAIYGQSRSFTHLEKLFVQHVNPIGFVAFAAKQSVDVSLDVGLVGESEQKEKVCIAFHVFNVIEALSQEKVR